MDVLCTHLSVAEHQCAAVWEFKHIPAAPLGWAHRWYHLIDAFFDCQWRRSNSIMPWSKPPLSALQFACTLQSHCAVSPHRPPNKTRSTQQEAMLSGKFLKSYIIKKAPCERDSDWLGVWQSNHYCTRAKEMSHHMCQTPLCNTQWQNMY